MLFPNDSTSGAYTVLCCEEYMQITVRMAGISWADRSTILVVTKKEGYIGKLVICKIVCDSSNDDPGSLRVVLRHF
jgi:hypothetical protein